MSLLASLCLVAIIWLQALNGTNSDFPAFSSHLKHRLGISQVQLNNLAVASDTGKLLGWLSGVAADYLPLPLVLLIGAILGLIGYGLQYLFLANKIRQLSFIEFFILNAVAGNSICWINTVCYVASMRKFPTENGTVLGLATSYFGLSAKVYIAMVQLMRGQNPSNKDIYLLLNAVVPMLASLILMSFFQEKKAVEETNMTMDLATLFVIAGATGGFAVMETLVPRIFGDQARRIPPMVLLVLVMLVGVAPLTKIAKWMREKGCKTVKVAGEVREEAVVDEASNEEEEKEEEEEEEEEEKKKKVIRVGAEHGVKELAKSLEFWVYCLVYLFGATLGLVYGNNLGQIAESRGESEAVLLSISSSFVFYGKLASAPLSVLSRSRYMISRQATVAVLMVPMAGSFFLLLHPSKACLFISTAIVGMSSGAITSIAVSITSDLFGAKHFGVNHNIVVANIPIGSFLFGYVAARIYDAQGGEHGVCIGPQCYHKTFIIWGSVCSLGTVLSFVLYYRTRNALRL